MQYLEDLEDKKTASSIVSDLMKDENLSRNFGAAIARNMSALWSFAETKGLVKLNHWQGLRIKKGKSTKQAITQVNLKTITRSTKDKARK